MNIKDRLKQQWKHFARLFPRAANAVRWFARIMFFIFLIDIGYLIGVWPQWKWFTEGDIPKSQFIADYERKAKLNPTMGRLRWQPVAIEDISIHMIRSVLAAEDSRFFDHQGFDTEAFKKAMEYNWERKRFIYGASTISQQTTKNLFLSPSKNPFRKWHELVLTWAMESNLKKKRIMELYLNVAEFGPGIYGVEAAARRYWGKSAKTLNEDQAIELAATLPAPRNHKPSTRTQFFLKQTKKIKRNLGIR
ncbi:MAG: monofunctional biosynthetic peptidoglycan transglycosylase [Gammaproteobacteria bacterium]|nr:monofunctional biosynthetic peptidoglycan transglycosylase [Gammaproteobacteria bacterium]